MSSKTSTTWDLLSDPTIKLAYGIVGELTGIEFERIREKYNKFQPKNPLPSTYHLNKKLPVQIIPIEYELVTKSKLNNNLSAQAKHQLLLGVLPNSEMVIKCEEDAMKMFSDPNSTICTDELKDKVVGARIDSNYVDVCNLMIRKHHAKNRRIIDGVDDIIVINSFDGADAFSSPKKVSGVISFSSSLMTPKMISNGDVKAGESFNICTWMQVMGKESFQLVDSATGCTYWNDRHLLSRQKTSLFEIQKSKVWVYDVHDGKMLYNLLQHSTWSRKHHPFLFCKCLRNAGLDEKVGDIHQCTMINDDDEYHRLFE